MERKTPMAKDKMLTEMRFIHEKRILLVNSMGDGFTSKTKIGHIIGDGSCKNIYSQIPRVPYSPYIVIDGMVVEDEATFGGVGITDWDIRPLAVVHGCPPSIGGFTAEEWRERGTQYMEAETWRGGGESLIPEDVYQLVGAGGIVVHGESIT